LIYGVLKNRTLFNPHILEQALDVQDGI
jgi:hypothetical protein